MNTDVKRKYTESRRKDPLFSAQYALANAKTVSASGKWEGGYSGDAEWSMEQDGLTIKLRVEDESIFPRPDRNGVTDFGRYVDEVRSDYYGEWDGNWPPPAEKAPLGLPYTTIRYSGPGWVQGDMNGGYFILDGIEEYFQWKRNQGQSKSVAWDLTRQFVEDQLTMLFVSPLTHCVVFVEAWSDDVKLASTAMGTEVSGDDDGRDYIFDMVDEAGMVDEVVEDAKAEIKRMAALEA